MKVLTIGEALKIGQEMLQDDASTDSKYLLSYMLQCDFSYLYSYPEQPLTVTQQQQYYDLLRRRQDGEPVAYLMGERDFWSLTIEVNPATLIPRPDTETLVRAALEKMAPQMKVADIGTGSGAIALAIATERSDITIFANDKYRAALAVAAKNRQRYQLDHVYLWQGDWLTAVQADSLDIIISNPPYIADADPHFITEDIGHEPITALVSAEAGLADIKQIIQQALSPLRQDGWLMIEHGYQQAHAVQQLFRQQGYRAIYSVRDYGGHERVTMGQLGYNAKPI